MDGKPRHFLLFYVSSTIAGPLPFPHPFVLFFISSKVLLLRRWCECASSHKWRARKLRHSNLHSRNEGRMEGRKAAGLTRRKRRRTSLQYSSSSSSWSPIWSTSIALNEYSSLKIGQAKIIPFLSAFHRQNIDHCLREEVYVQLHDPKPASFCS